MAGEIENLKGKGFDAHPENINRRGRPKKVSIKRELEKLLVSDDGIMFTGEEIIEIGENDGVQFAKIKVPNSMALAFNFLKMANGDADSSNTMRAMITILEQMDGKPQQNMKVEGAREPIEIAIKQTGKEVAVVKPDKK